MSRIAPSDIYVKTIVEGVKYPRVKQICKTYTDNIHSTAKREAFMICGLTHAVNEALRYHKHRACEVNFNETYTVHDDPLT